MPDLRIHGLIAAALLCLAPHAHAQQSVQNACVKKPAEIKTYHVANVASKGDLDAILASLREVLDPCVRAFVTQRNTIVVNGPTEQQAIAQQMITDLDRPGKTYRLNFTLTDFDGSTRVGTRQYTLLTLLGQHAVLNEGIQVPIIKGKLDKDNQGQIDYTELDATFDVNLEEYASGLLLHANIEQFHAGDEKSALGPQDPVLHHADINMIAQVPVGKPTSIGQLALQNSTHHLEISLTIELAS